MEEDVVEQYDGQHVPRKLPLRTWAVYRIGAAEGEDNL